MFSISFCLYRACFTHLISSNLSCNLCLWYYDQLVHFDKENANVYRQSLWKYSKRFHCSFEWHLTPHMTLSIETCIRACLYEGGGPQVGEVTWGGLPYLTCKRDHIKMRDYVDWRVTSPKRVNSPIWGTSPPCKQVLRWTPCIKRTLQHFPRVSS